MQGPYNEEQTGEPIRIDVCNNKEQPAFVQLWLQRYFVRDSREGGISHFSELL